MTNDLILGRTLQELRLNRGLTQEELASAINVERSVFSRIEAGARTLSAVELGKLAATLRVEPARLLGHHTTELPQTSRVLIEGVRPEVDGGQFPAKRVVGERVVVEADIFADGHDVLSSVLKYRGPGEREWTEVALELLGNDHWRASFEVSQLGHHFYTIEAWIDPFKTWRRDLQKRIDAGQDVTIEMKIGAQFVREAAQRARSTDRTNLDRKATVLASGKSAAIDLALDAELDELVGRYPDRQQATAYPRELEILVEAVRARYGAWYEMFPRSTSTEAGRHGTFKDCEARLPYVAEMGFDVLYLPPIHPIGKTNRKGPNNSTVAKKGDHGSPWAIGSEEGGHKSIHPDLGTLADFRSLVEKAKALSIDVALDIALQCSPDHPYVKEHPSWFRMRPDGTVQYAENPPKKYEDIYPLNFESEDWFELWQEIRSIFLFWIEQGVRIFRIDNPHTKPLRFWAWVIAEVRQEHPDVIFLAEAFTRPRIMYGLAKLGFSQSYNYFAWRNLAPELREYFTELTQTEVADYFRPNLWPNTPDILTEYLQIGGKPAFVTRLLLAATLGASYGIYGPPYELCEATPREHGSEEYLNSEKYEIKNWDLDQPYSLKDLIARINRIRRANPALQSNEGLTFHDVDNANLLCYSKRSEEGDNLIIVVVNVDPHYTQAGWLTLDLKALGMEANQSYQVHDLLSNVRYLWNGSRNYVELNPHQISGHVFAVNRRVRRENDFDYFA